MENWLMPGEKPKGQHFVHRAYLEGFEDPDRLKKKEPALWVYMAGKSPLPQHPRVVAKRNYYYCFKEESQQERNFMVEHTLQKLEDSSLPVLRRLRDHAFDMNDNDRLTLAGYIALSHVRVPSFEKAINRIASLVTGKQLEAIICNQKSLERVAAEIQKETGKITSAEQLRDGLTGGSVIITQNSRMWSLGQMFDMLRGLQNIIFNMEWAFLKAPSDDPGFITSDNPVSLFDPLAYPGFYSSAASHFYFPICRTVCLYARHSPGRSVVSVSGHIVREINKCVISRADTQLYAPFRSDHVGRIFSNFVARRGSEQNVILSKGRVIGF